MSPAVANGVGGQHQVLLLARALARQQEIESVVITGRATLLANRLEAAGVRVHPVRWGAGLDPRVTLAVLGQLGPRTIVHAHDNHAHALADLATRLRRVPLVVTRRSRAGGAVTGAGLDSSQLD